MVPTLALIGICRGDVPLIPIPIPLFLFWPLVGFLMAILAIVDRMRQQGTPAAAWLVSSQVALRAFCQLRGLRIDVHSAHRERVLIRLI